MIFGIIKSVASKMTPIQLRNHHLTAWFFTVCCSNINVRVYVTWASDLGASVHGRVRCPCIIMRKLEGSDSNVECDTLKY